MDYKSLKSTCVHDPFPTPFSDEVHDNVVGNEASSFIDGFCQEPDINIALKNLRKSTQRLETKIISDNEPLRGGNLLLPHINVQVQDDSKWKSLLGIYRRLGGIITNNGLKPT